MSASPLQRLFALTGTGMRLGLDGVSAAVRELGIQHPAPLVVLVAGTNGKGTCVALVDAALRDVGVRVGTYTSPHLHHVTERCTIDGRPVSPSTLEGALETVFAWMDRTNTACSFFEVMTLAAGLLFASSRVDVAIFEVGLGGRLDATNAFDADLAAITSIGLDHTHILGATLGAIAREKAAIARPGRPLIVGAVPDEARRAIAETATRIGARLHWCGDPPALLAHAAPVAGHAAVRTAQVAHALYAACCQRLDRTPSLRRFAAAVAPVRIPCRWERIGRWLLDGAHNPDALAALVASLRRSDPPVAGVLFGALRDKAVGPMLAAVAALDVPVVLTAPPVDRAFDPRQWAAAATAAIPRIPSAVAHLEEICPQGTLVATGSFFLAAAVRALLLHIEAGPPVAL